MATLYRDAEYGALAVLDGERPGTLVTIDHGLSEADFDALLGVLQARATCAHRGEGKAVWELMAHPLEVTAAIRNAMRQRGYDVDKLGERAILTVEEGAALAPDLPAVGELQLSPELAEAAAKLAGLAVRAMSLGEHKITSRAMPRPNARDAYKAPLPFVITVIEGAGTDPTGCAAALRAALSHVKGLVRATVERVEEGLRAVFAYAPPRDVLEQLEPPPPETLPEWMLKGVEPAQEGLTEGVDDIVDTINGLLQHAAAEMPEAAEELQRLVDNYVRGGAPELERLTDRGLYRLVRRLGAASRASLYRELEAMAARHGVA